MGFHQKRRVAALDGININLREAGSGEKVLLFHCSASSGRQWEPLVDLLEEDFQAVAPDLIGYGDSDNWHGRGPLTLKAHVLAILHAVGAEHRVHLVGHSCGGALAMRAALELGPRLRSLTLIEPSAFNLLRRGDPGEVGFWYEISNVAADVWHGARSGDHHGGMQRFVEYWSGAGAWSDLRDEMRERLARQLNTVATDFAVLFSEPSSLADYTAIEAPVLILQGSQSPAPSRRLCSMLSTVLPACRLQIVEGAGHMSPITHANEVNEQVRKHLYENRGGWKLEAA